MSKARDNAAQHINHLAQGLRLKVEWLQQQGRDVSAKELQQVVDKIMVARMLLADSSEDEEPTEAESAIDLQDWELDIVNDHDKIEVGTEVVIVRSTWTAAPSGARGTIIGIGKFHYDIRIDGDKVAPGFGWYFTKDPSEEFAFRVIGKEQV